MRVRSLQGGAPGGKQRAHEERRPACEERGPSVPLNQTSEQGVVARGTLGLEAAPVFPLQEQASGQAAPPGEAPQPPAAPSPE